MNSQKNRNKKQINLRLTPTDYETLKKQAARKELSLYAYVSVLLEKHASRLRNN
jgi:predicted HicB family RNase H-like nuclease